MQPIGSIVDKNSPVQMYNNDSQNIEKNCQKLPNLFTPYVIQFN